ncbi:MAG: hypothetical protein GT600_11215 [Bacteroidales bacterium]|jgi:hypothetical protein|nr:hypothetical protein [Bacteroidales bacterium]NMD04065.1 heme-binding domain-containing protein [Bacteroidales bacterium]OQB59791.1 MAG: hypothetical protein BWX96_02547 [Bacteroidetes bacterium ADurb.Bin145]HOU02958.1 heme-binding domain-containing protein [Bacteroidales bacterium]HQK69066.1 heme-binding domain-containing protein [Bacteroidales bacterium]
MKKIKIILVVLIVLFIIIQFIPAGIPRNKPEDEKSIAKSSLVTGQVLNQLKKSCFDCHSDQTKLPWYAKIAPSSWLLSGHINEGKSHLNFSEWEDYSRREKIGLLEAIKDEVESGNMPLKSYLLIHRDARLDSEKISLLSKWTSETSDKILE